MPERFLLDSSAFIAFLQAEPGAPRVLDLLEKAKLHSGHGLVSWERQQQIKSNVKAVLRF